MQVTQTSDEGLKREFRVVLAATDLESRASSRINELKDRVRLNGFRPGKVPAAHLRKLYGRSVMAEIIQQAVTDANAKLVEERGYKLALAPKITLPENEDEITAVMEGRTDLAYTVAVEVLPEIAIADLSGVTLEKPVAPVEDAEIDQTLNRMAENNRPYSERPAGETAQLKDRVTISFVGTIGGEPFEGGSGDDMPVVLGSDSFVPGFESQLVGIAVGESRKVEVTFPVNYLAPDVAGKAASFDVTCKKIEVPGAFEIDDEFAKTVGIESLNALKDAVRARLASERDQATRTRVKRKLLDALDGLHTFALPVGLVEQEFNGIWQQITADLANRKKTFADEGTTEEAARGEYTKIAERRVRLGLVLAEVGNKAEVKVTDEEVSRALVERARSFPGQEQQVWDYYRKNPDALAGLRAPIFEDKVVDHLLTQVQVVEKRVTRDELFKEEEEETASSAA